MEQRAKAGQKCKLWHPVTAQAGLAYQRYSNIGQDAFWRNERFFREDKVQLEVYCCWISCFFIYVLTGKYSVNGISYCMAFGSDFDLPPRFWATHRTFSQSHLLVSGQPFAWYKNANDRVKKEDTGEFTHLYLKQLRSIDLSFLAVDQIFYRLTCVINLCHRRSERPQWNGKSVTDF